MTRPGVLPPTAPPSWRSGPAPVAAAAPRAVSAPRWAPKSAVAQGSRVVQAPVSRYPGVVVQAYSPGMKLAVRQVSSPNLSPSVMAAHSPGLLVQHGRNGAGFCAPLPTWAAPATPPRAGMSCKVQRESDELPAAPAGPSGSVSTVEPREDELRAKLEVTRRELNQKMNELRELEASLLSTSFTKRLVTDPVPRPCDVLVEESETTGQSSGTPSPDSQTFFKCSTRAVATDTDDLICEGQVTEVPVESEAIPFQAVEEVDGFDGAQGVEVHEFGAQAVQETEQETQKGEESLVPSANQENSPEVPIEEPVTLPKRLVANPHRDRESPKTNDKSIDRSSSRVRIVPPRPSGSSAAASAASAARSRSTSVKDRPRMATQLHVPVSARLSSRREARAKAGEKRSESAREVGPRQTGTLELADVARLVASPEIGTLEDFLPNPVPEPEVLSEKAEAFEGLCQQKASAAGRSNQDSSSSSSARLGRRRSMPGSPKRAAASSDRPLQRDAPETTRIGSRMLWREQLTALSCSELPRRSPSPQRMPRATTPSRAKTPNRGTSASRASGRNEVEVPSSRSQKKQVTWKPRPRPNEEATASRVSDKRPVKIPDH